MLTVAPMGSTKLEVRSLTPMLSWTQRMVTGRVAVVALAQFHMVDLTLAQQAIIVLTATLASIGAAAIPSAGLVLMIIVLESVGLNPAWIALIFPVDRILDMCRTVVNVTGDGTVSALVAQSEGELHHDS